MTTKNCSLCGVLIDPNFDTCETCFTMLGSSRPSPVAAPAESVQPHSPYQTKIEKVPDELFETNNFAHSPAVAQNFQQTAPAPNRQPRTDFDNGFERFPAPPPAMTTSGNDTPPAFSADHNAEMKAAVQSFVPPAFATLHNMNAPPPQSVPKVPRYVRPPRQAGNVVRSEYKPTVRSWIKDLPTMAKVAAVVVVFSIGFAVILKGFMTLDVSIQPSLGPTEPQTPWFSSYFRSKPTPEEIFKKYESQTELTTGKAVVQSYLVSGKAQFLFTPPGGELDVISARKKLLGLDEQPGGSMVQTPAPPGANTNKVFGYPQPWDFDITFEMAMKNPNKMLMKMMLKPKAGFTQSFQAFQTVGFDGDRGWNTMKTFMNGRDTVKEGQFSPKNLVFNRAKNGISLAFVGSSFPTAELIGLDTNYNRLNYNVKLTDDRGAMNALFDIETGMLTRMTRDGEDVFILEHNTFNGVKIPSKLIYRVDGGWLFMHFENVQPDVALDDTIFLRSSN